MCTVENALMSARKKKLSLLATILSSLHFMYHFHAGLYSVLFVSFRVVFTKDSFGGITKMWVPDQNLRTLPEPRGGTDLERGIGMCGPEDPLFTPLLQLPRVPFQAKESVHKTPF